MYNPDCPDCGDTMRPATISGGGRVAWFCLGCETLRPDESADFQSRPP